MTTSIPPSLEQLEDPDLPTWYYDKADLKKTPSIADGIPYETECRYRRESARFIIKVGLEMKLRYDTMATGVVYMHRFYMKHSFKTFSRWVTSCGCLFLAGKVEETPKKCKDVIKVAKDCMTEAQFNTFGVDPKETVMIMERILLQTINFDLQVDHPYRHLLLYAKSMKGDKAEIETIVQTAWTFINDSLCTTICLQWEPEIVAIAVMFLAGKLCKNVAVKEEITNGKWWESHVENVSLDLLEDICHQILDLYSPEQSATSRQATPRDSPPSAQQTPKTPGTPIPGQSTAAGTGAQPPPPVQEGVKIPVVTGAGGHKPPLPVEEGTNGTGDYITRPPPPPPPPLPPSTGSSIPVVGGGTASTRCHSSAVPSYPLPPPTLHHISSVPPPPPPPIPPPSDGLPNGPPSLLPGPPLNGYGPPPPLTSTHYVAPVPGYADHPSMYGGYHHQLPPPPPPSGRPPPPPPPGPGGYYK